jgi:hypothetical protein
LCFRVQVVETVLRWKVALDAGYGGVNESILLCNGGAGRGIHHNILALEGGDEVGFQVVVWNGDDAHRGWEAAVGFGGLPEKSCNLESEFLEKPGQECIAEGTTSLGRSSVEDHLRGAGCRLTPRGERGVYLFVNYKRLSILLIRG